MKLIKLKQKGFTHTMILIAFVVVFAIAGVGYLVASHAQTPSSQPPVDITSKKLPAIDAESEDKVSATTTAENKILWGTRYFRIYNNGTGNLNAKLFYCGHKKYYFKIPSGGKTIFMNCGKVPRGHSVNILYWGDHWKYSYYCWVDLNHKKNAIHLPNGNHGHLCPIKG